MKRRFNRNQLITVIRLILSLIMLVFLFSLVDRQDFVEHMLGIDPAYFAIGLLCYFGFIVLWSVRWHFIMTTAGETVTLWRAFVTTLIGNFFALFLPQVVGSDLARMYEVSDQRGTNANIVSTVLLDRVIGLVSLVVMAVVAVMIGSQYIGDQTVVFTLIGLLAFVAVGWIIFFNRRFIEWCFRWLFRLPLVSRFESGIRNLYESLYALHNQPRLFIVSLLLSLAAGAAEVIAVIFVARALNLQISPVYYFIFMPIIWVVTTIPISISGLGLREGAFAFFFGQIGVASSDAVALSLLYYSYLLISGMVGSLLFLWASIRTYLHNAKKLPA